MVQTLSRAPAIADILFVHLWYIILEEAVGRPREEQTRLLLQPEVRRLAERKSSFPAPPGAPHPPPSTSRGSCDPEVNAGASAPLLPGGSAGTGGPSSLSSSLCTGRSTHALAPPFMFQF